MTHNNKHRDEYKRDDVKPQTVYILTEGVYSDYHIVAVFSTPEKLEDSRRRPQ